MTSPTRAAMVTGQRSAIWLAAGMLAAVIAWAVNLWWDCLADEVDGGTNSACRPHGHLPGMIAAGISSGVLLLAGAVILRQHHLTGRALALLSIIGCVVAMVLAALA